MRQWRIAKLHNDTSLPKKSFNIHSIYSKIIMNFCIYCPADWTFCCARLYYLTGLLIWGWWSRYIWLALIWSRRHGLSSISWCAAVPGLRRHGLVRWVLTSLNNRLLRVLCAYDCSGCCSHNSCRNNQRQMNMNNELRDSQSMHNMHTYYIKDTADVLMFLKEVSYAHQDYMYLTKNICIWQKQ